MGQSLTKQELPRFARSATQPPVETINKPVWVALSPDSCLWRSCCFPFRLLLFPVSALAVKLPTAATYTIHKTALYWCNSLDEACLQQAKEIIEECNLLYNQLEQEEITAETVWAGINKLSALKKMHPALLGKDIAWFCVAQAAFLKNLGFKKGQGLNLKSIQEQVVAMTGNLGGQVMDTAIPDCGNSGELPEPVNLFGSCGLGTSPEGLNMGG